MRKRLGYAAVTAAITGATIFGSAGVAGAAHCNDSGAPGNSDYAAHVKSSNGPGPHDEGDHKGFSSCNEKSANYQP